MSTDNHTNDGSEAQRIESLLLDWHLERLDTERAQEVEEAVASSPELSRQSEALGKWLTLLDGYEAPEPEEGMVDSIIAGIEKQSAPLPFPEAETAIPAGTAQDLSASPFLSFRELIAIAACITLFVGIFVPGYYKAQNMARRQMCKNNLMTIWDGIADYARDHNDRLAYAGYVPGGSWLPWHQSRTTGVPRASNTRHIYKLLQGKYIKDARVFICPSAQNGRPMLTADHGKFDDFAEPANITYSVQYMNLPQGRQLSRMNIRMGLVADPNPLFDGRGAGQNIGPDDEDKTNSLIHEQGAGQNVLYVDGHAGWYTHPNIGVNKDNIYLAGKLIRYQGTETPISDTDTMLIP